MHETYRMLGREHEADLEREALKRRRPAELGKPAPVEDRPRRHFSGTGIRTNFRLRLRGWFPITDHRRRGDASREQASQP